MEFWASNMISTIYPNVFVIKANVKTVTLKETVRIFIYISNFYTYNVLNAWIFKDIFSKTNNAFSSDCCKNVYLGLRLYLGNCTVVCSWECVKGHLISKCLFGIFNSFKNRTKKFDFTTMVTQVELFLFVFWENWRHQTFRK